MKDALSDVLNDGGSHFVVAPLEFDIGYFLVRKVADDIYGKWRKRSQAKFNFVFLELSTK